MLLGPGCQLGKARSQQASAVSNQPHHKRNQIYTVRGKEEDAYSHRRIY